MHGLIFIFIAFILLVIIVLILLLWGQSQKKNYGPHNQLEGPSFCEGTLICKSWKAPTLGKQLQFDYNLQVSANTKEITGTYRYPADTKEKEIYSGQIFIAKENGQVIGRTDRKYFEGTLSQSKVDLMTMYQAAKIFKAPFQFEIINGQVNLTNTDNSQSIVNPNSQLTVSDQHIQGRINHSRESWMVEVDVSYHGISTELMALVILLLCNDMLDFHHDR